MSIFTSYRNKNIKDDEPYFCVDKSMYLNNNKETMFKLVSLLWLMFKHKKATACEIVHTLLLKFWENASSWGVEVAEINFKKQIKWEKN